MFTTPHLGELNQLLTQSVHYISIPGPFLTLNHISSKNIPHGVGMMGHMAVYNDELRIIPHAVRR